jgi:hypothetical protein
MIANALIHRSIRNGKFGTAFIGFLCQRDYLDFAAKVLTWLELHTRMKSTGDETYVRQIIINAVYLIDSYPW